MNISIKREQNNARISSAEREKFGAKLKTKNIFKVLAFAMLMPAMLLTTACSNDDDAIVNNETTNKKGYPLQVTVNVSRQGDDATRAEYNTSTKKLNFGPGDKLLVRGNDNSGGGAGSFAGLLDYDAVSGKFSGTIYTQNEYSGTADALFTAAKANWVGAALFPNGYETYEFLSLSGSGYSTSYSMSYNKAIAATKAAAVEQFSLETAKTYSSGFALSPENAILNFTITGLTDGAKDVVLKNGESNMFSGSVTPTSGTAAFALGARIKNSSDFPVNLKNVTLTIGGTDIAITSTNNNLAAGKIYNISRNVLIVNPVVGQVIGNNGKNYTDAAAAEADGATAVAKICYVGSDNGEAAPYNHGLALALSDANGGSACKWKTERTDASHTKQTSSTFTEESGLQYNDATHNSGTYPAFQAAIANNGTAAPTGCSSWFLASGYQWDKMANAAGSYANLRTNAGLGKAGYWSSSELDASSAWYFSYSKGDWYNDYKNREDYRVRACLAF